MQSLIRSKSAGVTGGRGTAGAGPGRDLLYRSNNRRTPKRLHSVTQHHQRWQHVVQATVGRIRQQYGPMAYGDLFSVPK